MLYFYQCNEFNKYHTDKYNILVDSIGMKSIKNLVDIFDQTLFKSGIIPSIDTIKLILKIKMPL